MRGADELLEHICSRAGISPGETTPDGRLTVEYAECLGACDHAPCMLANNELHKCLTKEKVDAFLESLGPAEG